MAGKYKGVQTRIIQRNAKAWFVPCAAHTLNLIGVHAAQVSAKIITVFGILQRIFTFFSRSTARWSKLMEVMKLTLKGHSDTRWSSKARAVNSLFLQIVNVYRTLKTFQLTCY